MLCWVCVCVCMIEECMCTELRQEIRLCWACWKQCYKYLGGTSSPRIHRNSLSLSRPHLLTYTFSHTARRSPAPSCTHRLMNTDVRTHTHTLRSFLAQGETLFRTRPPSHWPLVVNNDMTHPVERLLLTWAWSRQTGVHEVRQPAHTNPPPPSATVSPSTTASLYVPFISFNIYSSIMSRKEHSWKLETSHWPVRHDI